MMMMLMMIYHDAVAALLLMIIFLPPTNHPTGGSPPLGWGSSDKNILLFTWFVRPPNNPDNFFGFFSSHKVMIDTLSIGIGVSSVHLIRIFQPDCASLRFKRYTCLFSLVRASLRTYQPPKQHQHMCEHTNVHSWPETYLIFVIFFTRAKFLENKIYTEKSHFFALNM